MEILFMQMKSGFSPNFPQALVPSVELTEEPSLTKSHTLTWLLNRHLPPCNHNVVKVLQNENKDHNQFCWPTYIFYQKKKKKSPLVESRNSWISTILDKPWLLSKKKCTNSMSLGKLLIFNMLKGQHHRSKSFAGCETGWIIWCHMETIYEWETNFYTVDHI